MIESYKNYNVLMYIAAEELLDEDYAYAQSLDISKTTVSDKTKKKVLRRIKNYDKATLWGELPLTLKRIVAAILIVCTISMGMCLSIKAVREEIVNTVLEWYDKFVAVFYVTETTVPETIEEYMEPILCISGTEKLVTMKGDMIYQLYYISGENFVMSYQQDVIKNASRDIDNESNCKQENIVVNGFDALLFTYDDGYKTIAWENGKYSFIIYLFADEIDIETLILIAESVQ